MRPNGGNLKVAAALASAAIGGVLIGLFGPVSLALPAAAALFLMVFNPVWGMYAMVFIAPLERIITVGGMGLVAPRLISLVLLSGTVIDYRRALTAVNASIGVPWIWYSAFLALSLPGIAQSQNISHSLYYLRLHIWLLAIMFLVALAVRSADHLRKAFLAFVVGNVVLDMYILFVLEPHNLLAFKRVGYSVQNPTWVGFTAMVGLVLAVYLLTCWKQPAIRILLYFSIAILGFTVLITQSRSVWAALVLLFLWYLVRVVKFNLVKLAWIAASIAAVAAILGFILDPTGVVNAFKRRLFITQSIEELDVLYRIENVVAAKNIILDKPLTGVGLDMFRWEAYNYGRKLLPPMELPLNAHNTYLEIGADSGIPALVAYIGFLLSGISTTLAAARRNRELSLAAAAINSAIVVLMVVATLHEVSVRPVVHVILGLASATCKLGLAGTAAAGASAAGDATLPAGDASAT
jgi:O-antigen ligase